MSDLFLFKMYVTLTKNTQLGINIDNCRGERKIALREIYFSAAWNNISRELKNNTIAIGSTWKIVPDGYYDFCTLKKFLMDELGIDLELNSANSVVTMILPAGEKTYIFQKKFSELLGFKAESFNGKIGVRTKFTAPNPINLTLNKIIFVHLDELSTSENILNNNRSDLLRIFPSGESVFCKPVNYTFIDPQYRFLREGVINSLTVTLKNESGKTIDVKNMTAVFEII